MTDKAKTAAATGVREEDLRQPHTYAYAHRPSLKAAGGVYPIISEESRPLAIWRVASGH